jgi:hypothetical protein
MELVKDAVKFRMGDARAGIADAHNEAAILGSGSSPASSISHSQMT